MARGAHRDVCTTTTSWEALTLNGVSDGNLEIQQLVNRVFPLTVTHNEGRIRLVQVRMTG